MVPDSENVEQLRRGLQEIMKDSLSEELGGHVKEFVKNAKSEFELYERIRDQFINAADEDIRKFVNVIQRPFYASSSLLNLGVSIFQLIISAFLLIIGISVLSPSILNISITEVIQQFASLTQSPTGATYIIEGMLFVTGIAFVADAFNHLRSAAFYLRIAGIEIQEPNSKP